MASSDFELDDALAEFTRDITEVLGIIGSAIALVGIDGRLTVGMASCEDVATLEAAQEEAQEGPGADAVRSGVDVFVKDLSTDSKWPWYRTEAGRVGVAALAALPLRLGTACLGVLDLYSGVTPSWSDDDVEAAQLLGHMAGVLLVRGYLLDTERRADQLEAALTSRVVIEQAKGLLAAERQIPLDQAFEVLRTVSRNHNLTLRAVAEAIVERFGESAN